MVWILNINHMDYMFEKNLIPVVVIRDVSLDVLHPFGFIFRT